MNALVFWRTDHEHLRRFATEFGCEKIFYLQDREVIGSSQIIQPIDLYASIDTLLNSIEKTIVLDKDILERLHVYETTAMEIINRWRRSITADESYLSLKKSFYKYLEYWINIIFTNNIKLFAIATEPHVPMTYVPYMICKSYGIPVILLNMLPFITGQKINCYFETDLGRFDRGFYDRYQQLCLQFENNNDPIELSPVLEGYFSMYGRDNAKVDRVVLYKEKPTIISKINDYIERSKLYITQRRYRVLMNKVAYYLKANFDSKPLLRYIESLEEDPQEEKFFVFFLHYQPENTTLPNGGVFVDQMLVIDMISKCLPKGIMLYVKEHPAFWAITEHQESMRETRDKEFYSRIISKNNVRLIKHSCSSLDLLDQCLGVVNITGTAGYEAMFKGVPNIVFGYAGYSNYKYVYNVNTIEDCQKAINSILTCPEGGSLRDIRIFLKALEPDVFSYGSDDKTCLDNGVPAVTETDYDEYLNKLKWFYENTYAGYSNAKNLDWPVV